MEAEQQQQVSEQQEKKEETTVETPSVPEKMEVEGEKGDGKENGEQLNPDKMLVNQLKGELTRRGFRATGRKADLVQRLKDAIAGKIQPDGEAPPEPKKKAKKEEAEAKDEETGRGKRKRRASLKAREKEPEESEDEEKEEEEGAEEKGKEKPAKKPRKTKAEAKPKTPKGGKALVWSANPDAPVDPITEDDSKYLKIISWNVNGLAALRKKDYLKKYVALEKPDVFCFQETKWQEKTIYPNDMLGPGYTAYWNCSKDKKGYSGTAVFTKVQPINVTYGIGIQQHDDEGRVITVEFNNFFLVNTYIPNSGQNLERLEYRQVWDKDFLAYLKKLETSKPVVWCGDLNVAHQEIDLANPKGNRKTAGFTDEERKGFSTVLANGLVDVWRHQNADKQQFTYWSYRFSAREKNIGWRLDYFVASEKFVPELGPSFVRPDVLGSDHCPIGLLVKKHEE